MKTEQWKKGCGIKQRIHNLEGTAKSLKDISAWTREGVSRLFDNLEIATNPRFKVDVALPSPDPMLNQFRLDCIRIMEQRAAELSAEFEAL